MGVVVLVAFSFAGFSGLKEFLVASGKDGLSLPASLSAGVI